MDCGRDHSFSLLLEVVTCLTGNGIVLIGWDPSLKIYGFRLCLVISDELFLGPLDGGRKLNMN